MENAQKIRGTGQQLSRNAKALVQDEYAVPDLQAPVNVEQLNPHGTF